MMSKENVPEEKKAFKDWFDQDAVTRLADQFEEASSKFDRKKFVRLAIHDLEALEFHGRVHQLSSALTAALPRKIPTALEILIRSLPAEQADCESVTDGWLQWPLGHFIAANGIDHYDEAMEAMTELTKRFSSEFAIRPFVEKYPDRIFPHLLSLTSHSNPHVRRWCSEGIRTRLPWGNKLHALIEDPSPVFPILEKLKDDPELYVRRSVANNLNDIAKDHPDRVVTQSRTWKRNADENRAWLIRHALRSLIKDGHSGALSVLGFSPPKDIEATIEVDPKATPIGGSVTLRSVIQNTSRRPKNLIIDYAVHYVRKGEKFSDKVFKWKTTEVPGGGELVLEKKHSMKETTVRALYPGDHRVELQINGVRLAECSFELT